MLSEGRIWAMGHPGQVTFLSAVMGALGAEFFMPNQSWNDPALAIYHLGIGAAVGGGVGAIVSWFLRAQEQRSMNDAFESAGITLEDK